jgi:hypothetical protein
VASNCVSDRKFEGIIIVGCLGSVYLIAHHLCCFTLLCYFCHYFCQVQCRELAKIKGIKFSCRGRQFAENTENVDHHYLHDFWSVKRQYRSWFRFQDFSVEKQYQPHKKKTAENEMSRIVVQSTMFGQMDYCFRLNIPGEPFIDGLAMGHCSTRDVVYNPHRWQHWVDPGPFVDTQVHAAHRPSKKFPKHVNTFVCLNYVDSTAVAVR